MKQKSSEEEGLVASLYRDIGKYNQLKQSELEVKFHHIQKTIDDITTQLLTHTTFVEDSIVDIIVEMAGSNTHGRCIYRKDRQVEPAPNEEVESVEQIPTTDASPRTIFKKKDQEFLESSLHLLKAMANKKKAGSKNKVVKSIEKLNLLRAVFEQILESFCAIGDKKDPLTIKANAARHEVKKIRDLVLGSYLRLVFKLAHSLSNNYSQLLDNFQNGASGLLRAISYYDHTSGSRFASYATWWIRQAILLHLKLEANLIRLPIGVWQNYAFLERVRKKTQHNQDIDTEQLSQASGYSEEQLMNIYDSVSANQQIYSLDMSILDGDSANRGGPKSTPLLNIVEDKLAVSPDLQVEQDEKTATVEHLLAHLEPKEQLLLCLSYGLFDHLSSKGEMTPEEILRERLRQLAST